MTKFAFPHPKIPNPEYLSHAKIYAVGGCVRDALLGYAQFHDIDYVVVGATDQDMINAGLNKVGQVFPVYLDDDRQELALARTERKTTLGYTGFECSTANVTLEQDLQRRDFTINAMAVDLATGELIDPLNGRDDLLTNQSLRAVSDVTFSDDPLRAIRACRFAARFNLSIHEDTMKGILSIPREEYDTISMERIILEFNRAYEQCDRPSLFLQLMYQTHLLDVYFPELSSMTTVPEYLPAHPESNTFEHTCLVVDAMKKINSHVDQFWAAMLHDIGKIDTPHTDRHHGHDQSGIQHIETLSQKMHLPHTTIKLSLMVCKYHMILKNWDTLRKATRARILEDLNVTHDTTLANDVLEVIRADNFGRLKPDIQDLNFDKFWANVAEFCSVKGSDLINRGWDPGPELGCQLHSERCRIMTK